MLHCRDPAIVVRKQQIDNLTNLLIHYPQHKKLMDAWIKGILPQIVDTEEKVGERALDVSQILNIYNAKD